MLRKGEPKKSQLSVIGCVLISPCEAMRGPIKRPHPWLKQNSDLDALGTFPASPLSNLGEGGAVLFLDGMKHPFTQERKARSAIGPALRINFSLVTCPSTMPLTSPPDETSSHRVFVFLDASEPRTEVREGCGFPPESARHRDALSCACAASGPNTYIDSVAELPKHVQGRNVSGRIMERCLNW